MSIDLTKQTAFVGVMNDGISISKQSAYPAMMPINLDLTKQTAYIAIFPEPPPLSGRRRMPLIIN